MNRRSFIHATGLTAGGVLTGLPGMSAPTTTRLTILHTNDVHSRLDPFPMDGTRNAGLGGVAARAALIQRIRSQEEHVLLFDAGDIFQGTPYFNVFKGEPEMKAMRMMGYDAGVMGNHDFDAGIENFADKLYRFGKFEILMCNYGFEDTPMFNFYKPYKIYKKGNLRIGVTGVGIEMDALVPDALFGKTVYLDPVVRVNETAHVLRRKHRCDLVVCISHLGDRYSDGKVSDEVLAKESHDIDIILGGHTHRFFDRPREYTNKSGKKVIVNQVGWSGLLVGRLDLEFTANGAKKLDKNQSSLIVKNIIE